MVVFLSCNRFHKDANSLLIRLINNAIRYFHLSEYEEMCLSEDIV